MFDNQSEALKRTSGRGGFDLLTIRGPSDAEAAAQSSQWVAGWFALGYTIATVIAAVQGNMVWAAIDAACVALAGTLAFFIHTRQPRWATLVLLIWTILEVLARAIVLVSVLPFAIVGLTLNVALVAVAARATHGAFRLADYRRKGYSVEKASEVFK